MGTLIIKTNSEPLHDFEFVKPIEDILNKKIISFLTKHYTEIAEADLQKAERVIICGTSLNDNKFLEDIEKFGWIKNFDKPVLGICSGMQIISLVFGSELKKKTEIGFYKENFKKEFLVKAGLQEVYHLHNNYATLPGDFEQFTESKIPQAIKHKAKSIYGVLFHPEVRNKEMIVWFCKV